MQVLVGRIGRAHGIRGEVVVEVLTDAPELRFTPGARLVTEPGGPARSVPAVSGQPGQASPPAALIVLGTRWHSGRLLVRFEGVADRSAAEALRGTGLLAEAEPVEPLVEDSEEFFDHQLVGLAAVSLTGAPLGQVTAVAHPGAQDLLVVRTVDGREALVPFVAAIVPEVDLAGGRVVLDPPAGLLDLQGWEG